MGLIDCRLEWKKAHEIAALGMAIAVRKNLSSEIHRREKNDTMNLHYSLPGIRTGFPRGPWKIGEMNEILTIPGMGQSDRMEQIRQESARKARMRTLRIRQAYARQSMMETLRVLSQSGSLKD